MGRVLEAPRQTETAGGKAQRVSGRFAAGNTPPETRRRIVLGMLAAFAVLALYTFGRAVYDIGRNDGLRMETGHAGRVELPTPVETDNHLTPYLYGTDEE